MHHHLMRLLAEDDGMEFLECSIVGAVVVLAAMQLSGRTPAVHGKLLALVNVLALRWSP